MRQPEGATPHFDNPGRALLEIELHPNPLSAPGGGMAERLKAPVLKTGVRKDRGFESYSLRQITLAFLGI